MVVFPKQIQVAVYGWFNDVFYKFPQGPLTYPPINLTRSHPGDMSYRNILSGWHSSTLPRGDIRLHAGPLFTGVLRAVPSWPILPSRHHIICGRTHFGGQSVPRGTVRRDRNEERSMRRALRSGLLLSSRVQERARTEVRIQQTFLPRRIWSSKGS